MNIENIWTGVSEADSCQPCNASSHGFFPSAENESMISFTGRISMNALDICQDERSKYGCVGVDRLAQINRATHGVEIATKARTSYGNDSVYFREPEFLHQCPMSTAVTRNLPSSILLATISSSYLQSHFLTKNLSHICTASSILRSNPLFPESKKKDVNVKNG